VGGGTLLCSCGLGNLDVQEGETRPKNPKHRHCSRHLLLLLFARQVVFLVLNIFVLNDVFVARTLGQIINLISDRSFFGFSLPLLATRVVLLFIVRAAAIRHTTVTLITVRRREDHR
jgi:hypothetical protein